MNKIKLAIVDDSEEMRNALKRLIHLEPDFEIVLQAENGVNLLELLETASPDIILMDIRMPKMDGFEATEKVKYLYPNIKIIAFSQYDIESNIIEMNIRGVKSFIGKGDSPEELFKAIRTVKDGGVYMPNHAAEIIQKYLITDSMQMENGSKLEDLEFLKKLKNTELDLLWQVACHKSVKEIANTSSLSPNTINNRLTFLRKKLNLYGKGKLLQYALSIKRYLKQLIEWRNKK